MRASTAASAVLVFARAPVPGAAKTRLIPRLGAWGAARLQARLTALALRTAGATGTHVELHAAPNGNHPFFRFLAKRERIRIERQRGGDLGERMRRAFERALRRHRCVVLIGTDCPALGARDLLLALRLLRGGCDAVIAPAEDGGYALIGLSRVHPRIFRGIEWGCRSVLQETLSRMKALNFSCRLLRTVWDVDRPQDLERLRSLPFSASRPRAARR